MGGVIGVDRRDTGFAYVLYDILTKNGVHLSGENIAELGSTDRRLLALMDGRCQVTLLRTPYQFIAKSNGCHLLGIGGYGANHYQGTVGAVRATWLRNNQDILIAFKEAYKMGLDLVYNQTGEAKKILIKNMPYLAPSLIDGVFANLIDEKYGLDLSMKPNQGGLQAALDLRNKYGSLISSGKQIKINFNEIII
jgi:ABC-type nitrate/sulfonate/bicarbonate transport system substrate-binding protein